MNMKRNIYILLMGLLAAGCSDTDFEGDKDLLAESDSTAICLGVSDMTVTRSSGLETYEGSMKVYAVKKMIATGKYEKAIGNYVVWNTSTNPAVQGEWEYVAEQGEKKSIIKASQAATPDNFTVPQKQVRKFWDYKSSEYLFWAVAPYSDNVTFNVSTADDATKGTVTGATVTGIGGHLTANNTTTANNYTDYFFARPVRVAKNAYGTNVNNNPVQFSFDHMHAWVRVGIYETISNYKIKDVTFYNNDATPVGGQNIVFNRDVPAFVGGNGGTADITYNSALSYSIAYSGLTAQKWIQFGRLYDEGMADPSDFSGTYSYMLKLWGTDGDMNPMNLYFKVLPTPSALVNSTAPITMKMDLTLVSQDAAKEEIRVRGLTATVPTNFSTWLPNHAYSYVFKITQAALDLKKIEFDAEASNITVGETIHQEPLVNPGS